MSRDLDLNLPGRRELVLRGRYETLSTANDLLVALWFLVGSILFLRASTTYAGTWLFIVGSAQLLARPAIRLTRRFHLRRHTGRPDGHESHEDF
ncbi:YrhK family protein [Nocardioides acrostichi]|uniref:YrhK family protein n=1 Tax=Nocardioides acrostichi TaxID=2784339 RepID=UPI002E289A4F|nr:YrhK family protein [Nocardioides acrostichi]